MSCGKDAFSAYWSLTAVDMVVVGASYIRITVEVVEYLGYDSSDGSYSVASSADRGHSSFAFWKDIMTCSLLLHLSSRVWKVRVRSC